MKNFLRALEAQRWDDHRFYHHSRINQTLHFISAISFVVAYCLITWWSPSGVRGCGGVTRKLRA